MDIKVSVIIPVYNTEKYLRQCLDSLVNQTLKDIEIICINDGSTDSSPDILEEYANKDSRIKIINQENMGQSVARNAGMDVAQGEYIAFLDSDDYAKADMLQKLYDNAKQHDSDMVMCSIEVFNEKTKKMTQHDPYLSLDIFNKSFENRGFSHYDCRYFLFRICVTPWNKIFKRSFIENNNITFVEKLNYEDNVFSLETILKAESITIIKEPLIVYRKESDTSYSFGNNDYKKLDFFRIVHEEEKILKENNIYSIYEDFFLFHKKNLLFYWFRKINNPIIKILYFFKLSLLYPTFIFEGIKEKYMIKKAQKKIEKLLQTQRIIIWGSSKYVTDIIQKIKSDNILGFVDVNPQMQGKYMLGKPIYSIEELKLVKHDSIVAISHDYYHFDKWIKQNLDDRNINSVVVAYSTYS